MDEKERYKTIYHNYTNPENNWMSVFDNETGKDLDNDADFEAITNLLNQQDRRIKELEEENGCIVFADGYDENGNEIYKQEYVTYKDRFKELLKENQQLKQQLHDLPKKIVEEIQENFDWRQCCEIRKYYDQQYIWFNYVAFNDFLDTILKKYGGENE